MAISKSQQARDAFKTGDVKNALKIASTFKIGVTRKQKAILSRGYEVLVNPSFYKQLGYVPEECVANASTLFVELFTKQV